MRIHEFLSTHRSEIGEACVRNLRGWPRGGAEAEPAQRVRLFLAQLIARLHDAPDTREATQKPSRDERGGTPDREAARKWLGIESAVRCLASLLLSIGEVSGAHPCVFEADDCVRFDQAVDDSIVVAFDHVVKDAEAAHARAASERLGMLAHELRNAMSPALLAVGEIRRRQTGLDPRLEQIQRSLRRMDGLIDRALADVRLGDAPPTPLRALGVAPLLRDIGSDCVLEREISLRVDIADDLLAWGDEEMLTRAVGNLVQNGIRCSHDGGTIALRARAEPAAVVIEIEDECGGLPDGATDDIFKPFVRRCADRRGLGLGLAIARRAADAMSAEITVRDIPGKGCVFALRLQSAQGLQSGGGLRCGEPEPDGSERVTATRS